MLEGCYSPCLFMPSGTYDRDGLREELKIMVTVGVHPNIISLIGACTRNGMYTEKSTRI